MSLIQERLNMKTKNGLQDIAVLFQRKIRQSGMTQKEVAEKVGVTPQALNKMINGAMNITVQRVFQLLSIFPFTEAERTLIFSTYKIPNEILARNFSKLLSYRERTGITKKQLSKILGVSELTIQQWETYEKPFDQKYSDSLQKALRLSDADLLDIISDSEFTPEQKKNTLTHQERALAQGKSFKEIDNPFSEAFRRRAIERIILTDMDPAAKNIVLQILAQL